MATTTVTVGTTPVALLPPGAVTIGSDPPRITWAGGAVLKVGPSPGITFAYDQPAAGRRVTSGHSLSSGERYAVAANGSVEVTVVYTAGAVPVEVFGAASDGEVPQWDDATDKWVPTDLSGSYAPKADVVTVAGTSETVDADDDGTYRRYTSGSGCTVSLAHGVASGVIIVGRAVGGTVTVQDNGTSTVNGEGTVAAGLEFSAISVGSNTWDVVGTTA